MKKFIFKKLLPITLVFAIVYGFIYIQELLSYATGYAAKDTCSCVFVGDRKYESLADEELNFYPIKYTKQNVDYKNKQVTATLWGMFERKAIYRNGLGCVLVNNIPEDELSKQSFNISSDNINYDTVPWPIGYKFKIAQPKNINQEKLKEAVDFAFSEPEPEKPVLTRGVLIIYDNEIIAERYAPGFNKDTKHLGWSMTKSVVNALLGIMNKKGILDVNQPIDEETWLNDERKNITMHHLLHMSSGLAWSENYNIISDVTEMIYGSDNMYKRAVLNKQIKPVEKEWVYSTGTTNIICGQMKKIIGKKDFLRFVYDELILPAGMHNTVIETDASGNLLGASQGYATVRDWAKLGLLYYNKGYLNNKRFFSNEWLNYSLIPFDKSPQRSYAAHIWVNQGAKDNSQDRVLPNAPTDCFYFDGYKNQRVIIIPSKKLVIVRVGLSHHMNFNVNKFVQKVIQSINKPE